MQIEDMMFIDQFRLVSLEYIFYQTKDAKYIQLVNNPKGEINHLGKIDHKDGHTHDNQGEPHFLNDPVCFNLGKDYLKYGSANQSGTEGNKRKLIDVPDGEAKVEALICMWKIDKSGKLSKEKEKTFSYEMYKPSQNGQMKLQLSNDKKYVILPIFEKSKCDHSDI